MKLAFISESYARIRNRFRNALNQFLSLSDRIPAVVGLL